MSYLISKELAEKIKNQDLSNINPDLSDITIRKLDFSNAIKKLDDHNGLRVYELQGGDIFTINGVFIEYELTSDKRFVYHELIERFYLCPITKINIPYKHRTGKTFTVKDMLKLNK